MRQSRQDAGILEELTHLLVVPAGFQSETLVVFRRLAISMR